MNAGLLLERLHEKDDKYTCPMEPTTWSLPVSAHLPRWAWRLTSGSHADTSPASRFEYTQEDAPQRRRSLDYVVHGENEQKHAERITLARSAALQVQQSVVTQIQEVYHVRSHRRVDALAEQGCMDHIML